MLNNIGQYAKALVGLASGVITALAPYYGQDKWFSAVTAAIGVLLVYAVPNQKPPGSV